MKKLIFIQLFIVLLLSSCLVGKRYSRPEMATPDKYINSDSIAAAEYSGVTSTDTIINVQWFQLFGDTVLNALIQQALDTNNSLKIAALRVQQSHSLYRSSKADIWPSIGYSATALVQDPEADNFNILGTASWELDFWGKLRHEKRARYAELIASEEGYKTIKTALVSDVANLYFLIRDLDNRIEVSIQTINSRQLYYDIVNQRFLKGESAELDKLQAEQQLALAQASLSVLQRELSIAEGSMNILLGRNPQSIPRGLQNADQIVIPDIPEGLPSTLLEQRPDIVAAENILLAETERIGVTQAMRLPSFNLTGFLGVASPDIDNLFAEDALAAGLSGLVFGPLFEFGKNKRRVEVQRAEAEIALNNFMITYRTALTDVEQSLVDIATYRTELEARTRQVVAARKALMLTKSKYDNGYSDYLEVLISESYAYDAEMLLSITRSQQLSATVSLYRALGGGW